MFNRSDIDDDFWEQLEEALIVSDVGLKTTMRMLDKIQAQVDEQSISEPSDVKALMREEISTMLKDRSEVEPIPSDIPVVLLVVGVNGSGKTTSIAKMVKTAKDEGRNVMLAAADTFRAGAIDQLAAHAEKIGVRCIKSQWGGDSAAVSSDAIESAKAKGYDIVIIDTAGRMQNKTNLMEEPH